MMKQGHTKCEWAHKALAVIGAKAGHKTSTIRKHAGLD